MRLSRFNLAVLVVAGLFIIAVGAGFLIGQTAFRPGSPPPAATMPTIPLPLASSTSPGPATDPQGSAGASPGGSEVGQASTGPTSPARSSPPAAPPPSLAPAVSPSAPTPPAAGPETTPEIPALPTRFHVQVGAFEEQQNAEALTLRLRSLGYAVTLTDGPPYRVWVGAYLDRRTAERLAENLRAAGFEATLTPR